MSSAGAADRSRAVGISIGNYGYVGTGWDGTQNWVGWWRFDPATNTWAQMSDFTSATPPGTARRECIAFSVGGFGYLGLGYDGTNTFQGIWKYDPGNNSWVNLANTGIPRYAAVSFVVGSKAYVCTGYDSGTSTYKNDLWEFTPPSTWVAKANFPGVARMNAVGFSIGGYGYVGTGYDGTAYQKDFWQYNPQTNVWVQKANLPSARFVASAFSLNGKGYVVGGSNGSPLSDTWEYNPISNQWVARTSFGAGNRYRAVGFSLNGKGYVGTGTSTGFDVLGDIWEYTPASSPSVTFQKSYGGTNDDTDTSRISFGSPTSDGGYIIAASTKSFGVGGSDVYLIKTNQFGSVQWTKTFGGTNNDVASSVKQTADGGYIIAGMTFPGALSDGLILKTDSQGGFSWIRSFASTGVERANYAEEVPGGGYIVTGVTPVLGLNRLGVIKLNSAGMIQWARSYNPGAGGMSEGFSVEPIQGGNYVVSGDIKPNLSAFDAYLTVVTSTGAFVSATPTNINIGINDLRGIVRATPDGGYVMCGSTLGTSYDIFLVKALSNGSVSYTKTYGGSNDDMARAITVTNTGEFVIAGYTKSFGAGSDDAFLMKVKTDGNVIWTKTYGGAASDKANSVYQTADEGYVLFGETSSFTSGGTDIYIIKTDSLGNSGCNENSQLLTASSKTPTTTTTSTTNTFTITTPATPSVTVVSPNVNKLCTFCTFPIGIGGQDVGCFGDCDGDAQVTAAGGAFPFTYLWSTGETTDFISGLCTGGYTVTVTDAGGCSATDSIYINEPPQLFVNLVQNSYTICAGSSTTIGANPSGGDSSFYSFAWYPSSDLSCDTCANTTASPPFTITYYLDVVDASGCYATDSVTIVVNPMPNVYAGADTIICAGQNTTLSVTGNAINYTWSPSAGLSCTTCISPVANPAITTAYNVIGTTAFGCSDSDKVVVTVVSSPTVSISSSGSTTICSGTSVQLTANSNGNFYSWSTGATASSITETPLTSTIYFVTVANTNGCTATDSFFVTVNPSPLPAFITTNVSCYGICDGQSTATPTAGTSPFTYLWNTLPVQTTQTATGLCAGIDSVLVKDANGCSAFGSDTINQPPVLDMVITPTDAACICSGSAVDSVSGGTAPYNYLWSPGGEITSAITGLCAGNYSVLVTDNNGCTDLHIITISQLPPVTVSASTSSDTICSGASVQLTALSNGNSYFWSTGATTSSVLVSPTANTTYFVIASAFSTSCSDTDSVFVNVVTTPSVSISGNATICTGGATTLTGTGTGNYLWNTNQTTPVISVSPTITTIYSLTVTATSGNTFCFDADSFTVNVVSSPQITVWTKYDTICSGLSNTTLAASGGGSYLWSTGQTNDTIVVSPDASITYSVLVTNTSGCSGVSTINITVQNGFPIPQPNQSSYDYCIGDSILPLSVTPSSIVPPAIVVWVDTAGNVLVPGNTYQPSQNLPIGTTTFYVLQGTSDSCASDPATVNITIHPLPLADAGNDITICSGHTAHLQASGGINYFWSPSYFLNDAAIANPSANPDSTISYQVLVTDANNCKETDSITVYISLDDTCGIHIYNVISPNGDGDNDIWWIDGINLFPDNFVELFNRWGNSVWRGKNYDNRKVVWRGQNEAGQPLPSGTYYYVIDVKGLGRFSRWVELTR